jgi:hypothetical protein
MVLAYLNRKDPKAVYTLLRLRSRAQVTEKDVLTARNA